MNPAFAPIRDKMERAYRNKERLHLDVDQVERLVRSPIWPMIAELTAQEIAESWQDDQPAPLLATTTPAASSSARSGSIIEPSATNGSSPGMMKGPLDEAVERAERQQALAAVSQVGRRRRRKTL